MPNAAAVELADAEKELAELDFGDGASPFFPPRVLERTLKLPSPPPKPKPMPSTSPLLPRGRKTRLSTLGSKFLSTVRSTFSPTLVLCCCPYLYQ
jgi:hypothetical protein